MQTGRNEPCPCGSGKKYKRCCQQNEPEPASYIKTRIDRFHDEILKHLFRHTEKVFGPDSMPKALAEFFGWPEEGSLEELLEGHEPAFFPWFIFNWRVDAADDETSLDCPRELSIAESYLKTAAGRRLAPLEREYLAAHSRAEPSFFEVIEANPGVSVTIRDLLLKQEYKVLEKSASRTMRPGDVFFASVVEVGGIYLLGVLGPVPFLPSNKIAILELAENMARHAEDGRITPATLHEYDLELREVYFDLTLARTTMPILLNTDGEKLSLHTLRYTIASPQKTFAALKDLTGGLAPEEALQDKAEYDDQGVLRKVEIPWLKPGNAKHAGMETNLLGRILINGREMRCEINSAERAKRLRALIEERLSPDEVRFQNMVVQSAEAMMREQGHLPGPSGSQPTHDELMAIPEVRAQIQEMMRKHSGFSTFLMEKWGSFR